jgi:hypothetical protein
MRTSEKQFTTALCFDSFQLQQATLESFIASQQHLKKKMAFIHTEVTVSHLMGLLLAHS